MSPRLSSLCEGWKSDGENLAQKLRQIVELDNPELQIDLLSRSIRPYIQVVETDALCKYTGLRLNNIWRYFRHTWVTSYKSVPGRSMMILIRDAAARTILSSALQVSQVLSCNNKNAMIGSAGTAIPSSRSSRQLRSRSNMRVG